MAGWEALTVPAGPNDAGVSALEAAIQAARHDRPAIRCALTWLGKAKGRPPFSTRCRGGRICGPRRWRWAALPSRPSIPTGCTRQHRTGAMMWVTPPRTAPCSNRCARSCRSAFQSRAGAGRISIEQEFQWLASHTGRLFQEVDCETGNTAFARCYWVEATTFDAKQRNDALLSTRVPAGSGAALGFGGFGYKPMRRAPGWWWSGCGEVQGTAPTGRPHCRAGGQGDSRRPAIRGDDGPDDRREARRDHAGARQGTPRVETRIVVPKRAELVTVRVQAQFLADSRELLVITAG